MKHNKLAQLSNFVASHNAHSANVVGYSTASTCGKHHKHWQLKCQQISKREQSLGFRWSLPHMTVFTPELTKLALH